MMGPEVLPLPAEPAEQTLFAMLYSAFPVLAELAALETPAGRILSAVRDEFQECTKRLERTKTQLDERLIRFQRAASEEQSSLDTLFRNAQQALQNENDNKMRELQQLANSKKNCDYEELLKPQASAQEAAPNNNNTEGARILQFWKAKYCVLARKHDQIRSQLELTVTQLKDLQVPPQHRGKENPPLGWPPSRARGL